jgi:hypothetical protein
LPILLGRAFWQTLSDETAESRSPTSIYEAEGTLRETDYLCESMLVVVKHIIISLYFERCLSFLTEPFTKPVR